MSIQKRETEEEDSSDTEVNPFTMLQLKHVEEEEEEEDLVPTTNHSLDHHQQQLYHLHTIKSTLLIRHIPSQGLSFQLWPAATTLLTLLDSQRPTTTSFSALLNNYTHRLRILELGSGTGVVGIAAAALLGADVTLTDLSHVLPNLHFNAQANYNLVKVNGGSVNVAALGWGQREEMEAIDKEEYDIIMGSDVVYHDHLYDPLLETLRFLLLRGRGESKCGNNKEDKSVVFVMSHLKRWKKESVFFKKANKYFDVQVIHRDAPCNGSRVGVLVYSFLPKKKKNKVVMINEAAIQST